LITYRPGKGLEFTYPATLSAEESATLRHAVSAFGFLLFSHRNKQVSWGDFAALIRRSYAATPRTVTVLKVLEGRALCGAV
jgi:hypothetical protein